jgi:hypothetical protein
MTPEQITELDAMDACNLSYELEEMTLAPWVLFWLERRPDVVPNTCPNRIAWAQSAQFGELESSLLSLGYSPEQAAAYSSSDYSTFTVQ